MLDLSNILNPEQYAAATAPDGPLLVLAAAGTGKTQTLVHRVAYLVENGVFPDSILLLTFTNRAANEMLERARSVTNGAAAGVWGGTFHHICNRLLRRHANAVGLRENFAIADREDARRLMDASIKELGFGGKDSDFPKRDVVLSLIGYAANRGLKVEQVIEEKFPVPIVPPDDIARVCKLYAEKKRELGVVDFDDMLVFGLKLLTDNPGILARYKNQFQYILVDEYQDTNAIQSRFVDILAGVDGNIMAVGDDFQCIYSWRGADFRNIMDFPKRHPNAKIIKLERNYRSTPQILNVANACIAGNPDQFQKTLRPTRTNGDMPIVWHMRDANVQSFHVAKLISEELAKGRPPSDIAVLYRSHFHSVELQMTLARRRIPFTITSGIGIFEQAHVKDMLSLLRLVSNPQDMLAFDRFFSLFPGIGSKSIPKLWSSIGSSCDLSTPMSRMNIGSRLKPAAKIAWQKLDAPLAKWFEEEKEGDGNVQELVNSFIELFYLAYMQKEFQDWEDRVDDLREVAAQPETQGIDLAEFLQNVALLTNMDSENVGKKDTVRLSTVHQAKGLEWPYVIILWAAEGMFPATRSIEETGDDSEERRLFYVAVTRAKTRLNICVPQTRNSYDGGFFPCKQSRFVTELPPKSVIDRDVYLYC